VVITTATGSAADAVVAMRAGASDFLVAPSDDEVVRAVCAVLRGAELEAPTGSTIAWKLLGESPAMQRVRALLRKAASSTATVLIRGESGTGKELAARALHDLGDRARAPFVRVHCAALPDNLLESELFGYDKGAFTGATARKPGRVELAERGTLFLDEIGDVTLAMQVKLLRLLQEREYERLGGTQTIRADVRFVAATHRDLESMVKKGDFRQDLFYRLEVLRVWMPPLRMRREDVPELARHLCRAFATANGRADVELTGPAIARLVSERWPGNVRQLANVIERLVVLGDRSRVDAADVEGELGETRHFATAENTIRSTRGDSDAVVPLSDAVQAAERKALERALKHTRGNRTLAAKLLGVSRATLYNKLEQHGVG
jgi:DNA-binding NtrC family response regulator